MEDVYGYGHTAAVTRTGGGTSEASGGGQSPPGLASGASRGRSPLVINKLDDLKSLNRGGHVT